MCQVGCRLLMDLPADGAWNMALDELLLVWAERTGQPIFRIYQWMPATLSLGYFQRWQDRFRHPASLSCPMVRRPSGGGAILHDQELTYCMALPYCLLPTGDPSSLYGFVHETLLEVFTDWGFKARLWQCPCAVSPLRDEASDRPDRCGMVESGPVPTSSDAPEISPETLFPKGSGPLETTRLGGEPFLCFQRRSRWDVVADAPEGMEVKLAGSAQRRSRAALLQHGSILLARSPASPELPGLAELLGRPVQPAELAQVWLARLAERLPWAWQADSLTPQERAEAHRLVQTKYGTDSWNLRR